MIKAIIFDCFGVLTTQGLEAFYSDYFKDSPDKLAEAKKLISQLNLGQLEYDNYIKKMAELSDLSHNVVRDYISNNRPNTRLLAFIAKELKPKYKIGMLSNASPGWLDKLLSKEDIALFDDIVLSGEVGLAKPQPEIYQLSARRLGVQTNECLFIDDLVHYCEAAQEQGMQAILYKDFEQMKTELEKLLTAGSDN
jgi:epoxide hydrolase-like predicted phosphatase